MNWTGGRLSRHSRKADGSIASKQKQHFAKVRSNFMNGSSKRSPEKWSIFDKNVVESRGEASVKSATLQTVAQHPSTGLNHDLHNHRTPSRKHRRGLLPHFRYRAMRKGLIQRTAADDEQQYEQPGSLNGYSTVVRPAHIEESVNGHNDFQDEMEIIRRKKLKILRNGDWVGLSIQRPLHLKYAPSGNQDGIGKRRRLHSGHKAQYEKIKDKIVSPFAPNRDVQRGDIFTGHEQNERLAMQDGRVFDTKSNVRIFIDGRERLIGASSSTAPNRPLNGYVQSSSSSDIMLLDLEGDRLGSERSFQIDPRVPNFQQHNRQGSRRQSTSSYGAYPSSGPHIHHTQGSNHTAHLPRHQLQDLWRTTAEDSQSHMVKSNFSLPSASSRLSARQTTQSNNHASQHDAHPAIQGRSVFNSHGGSEIVQKPKKESQSNSQQTDHKSAKTRRLIMPSSPPVIHHPTPRSSATSRLLRSDSAELESSIAATAGINQAATASEAQDEEMWKSWLVVDNDNEEAAESFAEGEWVSPVSISPGISAYIPHDRQDTPGRKSVQGRVSISSSGALSDRAPEPCGLKFVLSLSGRSSSDTGRRTDNDELRENPDDTILTEKKTELSDFNKISTMTEQPVNESPEEIAREEDPDGAWKSFILIDATKSPPELLVKPWKPVPKEDPDASWKKFVLSSDSDDENPAFDTFWKDGEAATTSSRVQKHRPSSEISLRVHTAETAFGSEQPSDPSSIIASIGAAYSLSTYPAPSLASGEDISSRSAVDGRPNIQLSRVSPEYEYNRSAQASSEVSEVCLVPNQRHREDPLSRYMPSASHSKRKIIFTKPVPFSAPRRDFEEGLEGTLREALHLGRRYAREERERQVTKGGTGKGRGKGYLIPLSDAVEDIDDD